MVSKLIQHRKKIQLAFGLFTVYAIFVGHVSLWIFMGIATVLGALLGKTYCKWMCPMGYVMETMTSNMGESAAKHHMYNYYKVGCPISWIQGALNKFSLFKIKVNASTCTSCGLCDQKCYITSLNASTSFFKNSKSRPMNAFNCSKCLQCVETCPTNSIQIKI